ncbi:MAG: TlpA family protein disulfide reductase [Bacteroidales bacterium]|nr:TlpA family protein disulfide reductase [Bacteroidales bacterium]
MKKYLYFAAFALSLLSCGQEKKCTVQGKVSVPDSSQPYYAVLTDAGVALDSCSIENGSFTLTTGQCPQKSLNIKIHDAAGKWIGDGSLFDQVMEIVPDARRMSVNIDDASSEGSPLTAVLNAFLLTLNGYFEGDAAFQEKAAAIGDDPEKMSGLLAWNKQRILSLTKETYLSHTDDAVGLLALRLFSGMGVNPEELRNLLAQGAGFIQENDEILMALLYMENEGKETGSAEWVRISREGAILSQETCDVATLYDSIVGQGQYVLFDFWASWCGPCREEIPRVIRLAEKYAGKGLKVVGVTVKDKPENSLKTIREMGIGYDQIFDTEGIFCNKFPLRGIPHFFLLDPSGEIILEGHHNLAQFDEKISHVL